MKYKIALLEGDGVGPELIKEGLKVLEKAAELDKFELEFVKFPHCADHYVETKEIVDEKVLLEIAKCSSIYCGTFGLPEVETQVIENSIIKPIKDRFEQFVFVKPVRLFPNVESRIKDKTNTNINFTIIRESSEEFHFAMHGHAKTGKARAQFSTGKNAKARLSVSTDSTCEIDYQIGIFTKKGLDRFSKFVSNYAKENNFSRITSIDKSNSIGFYSSFRDLLKNSKEGGIEIEHELIDLAVINFVREPEKYKLIAAPYLLGDILCDLSNMIQGGPSFSYGANINPNGISMFMPLHGSAAKLKEKEIVNPIATILAGAMMLNNIGQKKSSELIYKAVESVLKEGKIKTQDLDGFNSTSDMGNAIMDRFIQIHD